MISEIPASGLLTAHGCTRNDSRHVENSVQRERTSIRGRGCEGQSSSLLSAKHRCLTGTKPLLCPPNPCLTTQSKTRFAKSWPTKKDATADRGTLGRGNNGSTDFRRDVKFWACRWARRLV